ncbi:DUF7848 domain-containing protein [Streptomyces fumanus]|uniref:DUF7848 domain-containing protein n=1 Tax=Streptomyces fumanus TaxID=67302 RepID=UPI00403312A8
MSPAPYTGTSPTSSATSLKAASPTRRSASLPTAKPDPDPRRAGRRTDWALRHTGRTGHDLFRRAFTDHAKVTRAE